MQLVSVIVRAESFHLTAVSDSLWTRAAGVNPSTPFKAASTSSRDVYTVDTSCLSRRLMDGSCGVNAVAS